MIASIAFGRRVSSGGMRSVHWGPRWAVLGLWLLVVSGCNRSDASDTAAHSSSSAENSETPDEPEALADLEHRAFPLLVWSAYTVDKEYFDRKRFETRELVLSSLRALGLHSPEFFAEPSNDHTTVNVRVRKASQDFSLEGLQGLSDAADRIEEILSFAQTVLDLEQEPLHELEYAAINGLFAPLDPHTILLTPEEHADLGVRTKGEFGGIGAQIRAEGRRIVVVRVLPGMPAEAAGLKAGDVVLKIGEQATVNMSASEAQSLLRGPLGTKVAMKVRRQKTTLTVEVERATIRIESVESHRLPGDVAYLRITNFQENTAEQVRSALTPSATTPAPKGVVFDLRGNAGGLLVQATEIVDMFVPRGELVIVRSAFGREVDEANEPMLVGRDVPVIVLVDEESASAAEIVSGGLKSLGRAVVLGRRSFGKGTVQVVRPATPYGRELALKLTIAEYLVAGDHRIQATGVVPDLQLHPVEPTTIPGVVRYFDVERFERARERSRMAHHPSAKHELASQGAENPVVSLRYLATGEVPGAKKGETLPPPMRDPEVRIAAAVATGLTGVDDREARTKALQSLTNQLSGQENERIAQALRKSDVDWSSTDPGATTGRISVTSEIVALSGVEAGKPFTLRVSVTNEGDATLERVHAITDCIHDELDGIELMIGKLEPGDTAVRDVKLHVMPWHSDFTDQLLIAVHIGEPDDKPDGTSKVVFDVRGAAMPSLAYDFWIVDDPSLVKQAPKRPSSELRSDEPAFTVQGNGDGMLQAGERVLLAFEARNRGPGNSPDVRALLRNLSGKQGLIEEGLVPLGPLDVGKTKSGAFGISVSPAADPAIPFELELVIGDGTLRTSAQDKLRFVVLPKSGTFAAEAKGVVVIDEAVRLYGGAHPSSRVVATADPGTRLLFAGAVGEWNVLTSAARSRRYFVPADLASLKADPSVKSSELSKLKTRTSVAPPEIEVADYPRRTSAAKVSLSGIAKHPNRVRDVAVMVRPPGPSQFDKKVHYVAADAGATELSFEAEIPLEPGGNRIIVLARDGAKVQRRRDVWVFRDPPL